MSDLYLDLKRRIPVVTDWTDVGTEEMDRAQQRTGLSDERLARLIPVAARTWVRWKRRGQIPTHLLPKVAPILGFEMVPADPIPIGIATEAIIFTPDLRESLATMVGLLHAIAEELGEVRDVLLRIEQATLAPQPARRRVAQRKSAPA